MFGIGRYTKHVLGRARAIGWHRPIWPFDGRLDFGGAMQRHLSLPDLVGNALCRQASTNCHHFNSQLGLTSKQNHSLIEGVHYLTDRVIHSLPEDARTITPAHPGRSVNTSASNTTLTHYKKFTNEQLLIKEPQTPFSIVFKMMSNVLESRSTNN